MSTNTAQSAQPRSPAANNMAAHLQPPSGQNGHYQSPSSSMPSWYSRIPFFGGSRGDSDEEQPLLPAGSGGKVRRKRAEKAMSYLAFILIGLVLGVGLTKGLEKWREAPSHGPMVPPVWTLPEPTGDPRNPAYLTEATHGAVASEDKTCSELGVHILRDLNGTAVDAAITTTLCIGLINGFSSGIGGGGFLVIRKPADERGIGTKHGQITAIDFRETSPAGSNKDMYGAKKAGRMAAQVGGLAVGVPGELKGLAEAHKLYGKLPWEDLIMPVVELSEGWQVSRELARRVRIFGQFMLQEDAWREVYAPRGPLVVEGDYIKRTNYGKTLETIAKHGVEAFYKGELADKMLKTISGAGGIMTRDDLKGFKPVVYDAIHQTHNHKTVYTTKAPSSGGILLALLRILEPFHIPRTDGLNNSLNVHRFIEALKFSFGARSEVTDPAFVDEAERLDRFWKSDWADSARKNITDNSTHSPDYYGLLHDTPIDHGTTHLGVVDRWGGVASVTSTVNLIWGSHLMCPETGVIFNDEQGKCLLIRVEDHHVADSLDDFAVPGAPDAFGVLPSPWNYPAPGKKPLSSTSPVIILNSDGTLYGTFGGSGGSRIFGSLAQVLLNLESGLNLSAAIEKPRYHDQVVPTLMTVEVGPEGPPKEIIKGLKERGHTVGEFDINMGVAEIQGIIVENGTIWASSDSRKNGIAAGY